MDDPEDQENAKNICKHYLKGECRFRHNCKFLHPGDHAKTEAEPRELEDQEPPVPQPVQRKGWPKREKTEWAHIFLVPPACLADELELVPRLIGHKGEHKTHLGGNKCQGSDKGQGLWAFRSRWQKRSSSAPHDGNQCDQRSQRRTMGTEAGESC